MESHTIPHLYEIALFLVAAGIVVPLLHRWRISPVLAYLLIGAVVGPFGVSDLAGMRALAELGVIFLLFMIGLELSVDRLWRMRRMVFGLGSLQVLVTAAALGLIAAAFGTSPVVALIIGCCLALSSTAIVMQILMDRRQLASPVGRTGFSILLMQDLAVVPILFLVGVLGIKSTESIGVAFLVSVLKAVVVVAGIYFGGRLLLRPLFHMAARARNVEMFMALTLLVVIVAASLTGMSGLSMALGAFLAGLLLADTEFRHEIEVNIEPFKGLLLGLFFMTVGMGIDFSVVLDKWLWLLLAVVGLFTVKTVITSGLCLLFGVPRHVALETGLLLGQGGEFAFVVVGLAAGMGLLPAEVTQFVLIVTGLTMLATPFVAWLGSRLSARLIGLEAGGAATGNLDDSSGWQGHVLIAGFGRVGQLVSRALDADGVPWLALDARAAHVAEVRERCQQVYYGDVSRLELLRHAHAASASVMVLTMDNPDVMEKVVKVVKAEWPHLPVVARARDVNHARRLLKLGADDVIPEALEGGLQLAGQVLQKLGATEAAAARRIDALREETLEGLRP